LRSSLGSGRTKESKRINKKEVKKHLKRTAPEVMTSSEASLS